MQEIEQLIKGFINKTLPKTEWTHQAHLKVGLWHIVHFDESTTLDLLRQRIKAYNLATGGINDENNGYHETITAFYVWLSSQYKTRFFKEENAAFYQKFIESKYAKQENLLLFYSVNLIKSSEARLKYSKPDLQSLNFDLIN